MGGRAVLVTGGSGGIGRAVARAFADAGDRVAVHHNSSPHRAEQVVRDLPGSGHLVTGADLTEPGAVRRMVDRAAAALGGLDVLVNNAGVYLAHPPDGTDYQRWQQVWAHTLGVNLVGAANVTWCAVGHMRAAGRGGRVVNVSSRGAFRGEPDHPAYAASKAGLNAFGQSLARSLGRYGIGVGTVAPGFVDTEMAAHALAGPDGAQIRAQSPFDRVAGAEEVAAAVLFLASPEAVFTSGAILDLNGASHLRG